VCSSDLRIEADVAALGHEWDDLDKKAARTPEEEARYKVVSERLNAANARWKSYLNRLYTDFGNGEEGNLRVGAVRNESAALQNLLQGMAPGTVALYTLVLDEKCVIILITPAVKVARDVPVTRAALRTRIFAFVEAIAGRKPERELLPMAQALYGILIPPIEKDLKDAHADTLLWSLDDALRYVPLAALHDGKQYLAERFANVVITTTSLINLDRPRITDWHGLAMGVSKDYDGLGELNAVPGELDAVVTSTARKASHGPVPGTIMLDDAFTEKDMEEALDRRPPLIHIATHFVLNPGDDERSYLLLGGKDVGGKGYHLSLADLDEEVRIKFAGVELLTLSGCHTATGSKDSDGREVDSLGIVGQRKGAKAVVATLWKVDDASTGILMENFYRLWTSPGGKTKAEALRQAQLALLQGPYGNPYYWAPFVLIGNWK
jgi:CHAT domain-containing protein